MDARERFDDHEEAIRSAIEGALSNLWTAVPITIQSYDPAKGTVVAQPTIKAMVRKPDGTQESVTLPLLNDAPVHFPAGGGHTMTFPIAQGDEGLAIISSRSIDAWHQSGGIQQQTDARTHDLSDAMVLVGFRSTPRALQNASTNSVQLRSDDGKNFVEVGINGVKLQRDTASFSMDMSGNVTVVPGAGGKIYMG